MISALANCLEWIRQCHCHPMETFTCRSALGPQSSLVGPSLARTSTRMQVTVLCDGWLTIVLDERHSRVFTIVAGIWVGCKPQKQLGVPRFVVFAVAYSA